VIQKEDVGVQESTLLQQAATEISVQRKPKKKNNNQLN
jgi:hypothetical protein